jgi:hypothetical protein
MQLVPLPNGSDERWKVVPLQHLAPARDPSLRERHTLVDHAQTRNSSARAHPVGVPTGVVATQSGTPSSPEKMTNCGGTWIAVWLRMRAFVWLVGMAIAGSSANASADCGVPRLELLWSYPAAGERDVPVNAELWALVPWGWVAPVVRLDGQELTYTASQGVAGVVHLAPGALQPGHDYVLELDFTRERPRGVTTADGKIAIPFRTGESKAKPPSAPDVARVSAAPPGLTVESSTCPQILGAQDCIDTGPFSVRYVEVHGDLPLAWLVEDDLVPALCGKPQFFKGASVMGNQCVSVRAIGAGGLASGPTEACWSATSSEGCGMTHRTGGALWVLLMLLAWRRASKRGQTCVA